MGDNIDVYSVQFYNQGNSKYSSYEALFERSDGWASGTMLLLTRLLAKEYQWRKL